jgi:hypothetical protein
VQRDRSYPISIGAAYVVARTKSDDSRFAQLLAERHAR